jgi:hypothetical protein
VLRGARLPLAAAGLGVLACGLCLLIAASFLPAHGQLVVRGAVATGHFGLIQELSSWDASWYEAIAAHGYAWDPHSPVQQTPAFLPLYPLLLAAGHGVTRWPLDEVAVGVSVLCQAGAAAALAVLVRRQGARNTEALGWVAFFVACPLAVFAVMGYCLSLLCLLVFLAFLLLGEGRRWAAATAFGLASATNPIGAACAAGFVVVLVLEVVRARASSWRRLGTLAGQSLVAIAGLLADATYSGIALGDPLAPYRANAAWAPPAPLGTVLAGVADFSPLRHSVTTWVASPYGPQAFAFVVDSVAALAVVAVLVALAASRGGLLSLGFWCLAASLLLVQVFASRYGNEASTTRLLLPVLIAATASSAPLRRALARPAVAVPLGALAVLATVFFLQRMAIGQWID